jgi:signal transduction histidine kinase
MYNRSIMTPPPEWLNPAGFKLAWLKPPRSLLTILFLVTLVSVSALGWFGWKLLDQERVVEAQRAQERLEQAADRIAAIARGTLAETGERLGTWLLVPPSDGKPDEGLLLIISGGALSAMPGYRLLYRPSLSPELEDFSNTFTDGEVIEFQQKLPARAIEWYRRLADSKNPATRAGALMRLARVLRKIGRNEEARAAYLRLADISGEVGEARIAGVPAELVARHALCELSGLRTDAQTLKQDLLRARWQLTRGQFEYYWSEASRLSGNPDPVPAEAAALSEVVAQEWTDIDGEQRTRGQTTMWVGGHPWFLIWRGVPGRKAVLVIKPESLLKPIFSAGDVISAAVDGEGRVVAGNRDAGQRKGTGHAVLRTPAETQLPWTLYMTSATALNGTGMLVRQRFLLLVTAVMVLFLIAGAYFIARAIRGDLAVARMQSDFVSAVSHEFRSPLTSIRQLSEILAFGRVPNEDRRHVYYETLVRETTRLQRLVEALLNFGRMEAGVRQYRFEPLDTAALVSRVAAEFEMQIAGSGRHIELDGFEGRCTIDADPEALSVALRNLVDNALKYAPDCPTVQVQWGVEEAQVAIRVRDSGPGIPASEKKAIFRKFVRGSAAEAANVKGSGVGLAMVRHIVAAHGGDVTLASELGSGSVFTILLPLGAERP